MKAIYAIILVSGLYTDGHMLSPSPIPMQQADCEATAALMEEASCVPIVASFNPVDRSIDARSSGADYFK